MSHFALDSEHWMYSLVSIIPHVRVLPKVCAKKGLEDMSFNAKLPQVHVYKGVFEKCRENANQKTMHRFQKVSLSVNSVSSQDF